MIKPMLASDWVESKVKFPVMVQPKIDGVRGLNLGMGLTGRSLKKHANVFTTNYFSMNAFSYLDGELAANSEIHPDLCRMTTSAVGTIKGEPYVLWHLFDNLAFNVVDLPYEERYGSLKRRYWDLQQSQPELAERLRIVPCEYATCLAELEDMDAKFLEFGYEGTILRDPKGFYKSGRSTPIEGGLLRIKRFVEEEAVVDSIQEGQKNLNEAVVNELGQTARSTHMANMVPNGMVGAFNCTDVKTGKAITVAAGTLPHDLRTAWFEQPQLILKKTIKYKTFPKGVKDKPRFPTFQSVKMESDMP